MTPSSITPQLVRAALASIPATLVREDWARVAMAVKSEFPDAEGLDLFDAWSQTAGDGYRAGDVRSTWRSVKAGGGVGIGTLLHLAKEHGFDLQRHVQAAPPAPAELARRDAERARQRQQEQERREAGHAAAAADAQARWVAATEAGTSAYLQRKGVRAHGVRFAADGWLLVPVCDAAGRLWNLQRIAPEPVQDGPDKLFLKGGRKSGLWHMLGEPAGAEVLLIAEGYATAASLHEATGRPVAVAFDAGNLGAVARALRALYPAALLVVGGDDDRATEAAKGVNPGRQKADQAARAVKGLAVYPVDLPQGGSDFNDMHKALGLAAVRTAVEAALTARQVQGVGVDGNARQGADPAALGASVRKEPDPSEADGPFIVDDHGVWFIGRDRDGNAARALWLCSRLDVAAHTRDQEGAGWGYLLQFTDLLGKAKQWAMPARMLAGDGGEYRSVLLNMGLRIATSPTARNRLTEYIQTRQALEFASCTDRIGWHPTGEGGMAYVLPHETIGDHAERIVFQSDSQMENTFRTRRDANAWRERIGKLCEGNTRLVFAVACAFAGPLLRLVGMESGGFHFRGDSSSGKTTALRVAASVNGGASYMQRWRTTDNALESIAAQHCDALLILDELAQVEGRVAGECAYLLANEQSKARATRGGGPRARLSWRLLFLSAGELGLADHMAEGMKRARTGQEVRMADIPADAGAGLGAFEKIHDFAGGAAFASYLAREAQGCHGAVGRAFLDHLCGDAVAIGKRASARTVALARAWVPRGASGQVERVGARFALVAAAGELATEAGLTGWPAGEAERGARACFEAWLAARGGAGNGEVSAMLRAVRRFLEMHGDGRFSMWHRSADDHAPKTLQRAGVRRMLNAEGSPIKTDSRHVSEYGERMPPTLGEGVSFEYFILSEVFKGEVCQGFDVQTVCRALAERGCLVVKEAGRYSVKERLPGIGPARCYRIPPAIFDLEL